VGNDVFLDSIFAFIYMKAEGRGKVVLTEKSAVFCRVNDIFWNIVKN